MKRFAAHYLFFPGRRLYKLHWIELDDAGKIRNINPLEKEIAGVSFYNGILLVVREHAFSSADEALRMLEDMRLEFPETPPLELLERLPLTEPGEETPVELYHLDVPDLLPAKLGTDNSRRHSHIQRLC
jgi:hypothetical protein